MYAPVVLQIKPRLADGHTAGSCVGARSFHRLLDCELAQPGRSAPSSRGPPPCPLVVTFRQLSGGIARRTREWSRPRGS